MSERSEKAIRWAGLKLARRAARAIPVVGAVVAVVMVHREIQKKGVVGGLANTALDALPWVGLVKNGIELFTDDLIPDRVAPSAPSSAAPPLRSTPAPRTPAA